jgi:hypothetical protein
MVALGFRLRCKLGRVHLQKRTVQGGCAGEFADSCQRSGTSFEASTGSINTSVTNTPLLQRKGAVDKFRLGAEV